MSNGRLSMVDARWTLVLAVLMLAGAVDAAKPKGFRDIQPPPIEPRAPQFEEFSLANGIEGFVVEDSEVPVTNFYALFPAPPDRAEQAGLAEMTAWALRNGGGVNIPADSLNETLEYNAANLWIGAGQEALYIWGSSLKEDLPLLMSIIRELVTSPTYPDDQIELKRSTMLEQIRRRNDSPRGIASRELNARLYVEHPWGVESTEQSVSGLTRDDLLAYHKLVFRPDGMVLGFSGDVDLETARALIASELGDLQPGMEPIPNLPPEAVQADPGVYYAFKKEAKQAFVNIGHLSIKYDDPRRCAADLMNYILGGGGFNSRLTNKIRTEEGLAYSVWSDVSTPHTTTGSFKASASTRFEQVGQTLALLEEMIRDYRENGPSEDEFEVAKKAYVNSYVWKFESATDVLNRLVYYKYRGLPLDQAQRDLVKYRDLTLDEVRIAAREILKPDNLVIVVVGDRDKMDRPLEDFGEVRTIELKSEGVQ